MPGLGIGLRPVNTGFVLEVYMSLPLDYEALALKVLALWLGLAVTLISN